MQAGKQVVRRQNCSCQFGNEKSLKSKKSTATCVGKSGSRRFLLFENSRKIERRRLLFVEKLKFDGFYPKNKNWTVSIRQIKS